MGITSVPRPAAESFRKLSSVDKNQYGSAVDGTVDAL